MRKLSLFLSAAGATAVMAAASIAGAQVLGVGGQAAGSADAVVRGGGLSANAGGAAATTDTVYLKPAGASARSRIGAYSAADAASDTAGVSASGGLVSGGLITTRKGASTAHGSAGVSVSGSGQSSGQSSGHSSTKGAIRRD